MLVTILHWGIPPSLSSSDLLQIFSLLDLFFYLYESSYWGIPPLALFYWRIPPSLSLSNVLQIFLTTQSISWYLRVIILEHTLFSTLLLGHTPSLGSSYPLLISWSFNPFADISLLLGHTPFFVEFIIPVISLGFFLGISSCRWHSLFLVFALGVFVYKSHTSFFSVSSFRASFFRQFRASLYCQLV